MKNTDWCFSEVARVYADGIMGGTSNTTFSPAGTLTRGQVVAMLYRMAGSPAVTANTTGFSDVDNGAYYADAVKWASGKEIVGGYADGTFAPNRAITREQLAAILYRYAKANGADIKVTTTGADLTTQWADKEIKSGKTDSFKVKNTVTLTVV